MKLVNKWLVATVVLSTALTPTAVLAGTQTAEPVAANVSIHDSAVGADSIVVKDVPANTTVRVYDAEKKGTLLGSAQTSTASSDVEVVLPNGLPSDLSEVWVTFATIADKDIEKGKDKAKETEPVAKHFLKGLVNSVDLQVALKPGAHAFSTEVNLGAGHTASELSNVDMKFSTTDGTLLADVQTSSTFSTNHATDTQIVGVASREQKATDVDADFTYSDWNGGVYDVPGQTAVTVTDREGNVYTAGQVHDLVQVALDAANGAQTAAELQTVLEDPKHTTVLGIETGAGSQYATLSDDSKASFFSNMQSYSQSNNGFSNAEVLRTVFTNKLKGYLKAPAIPASDITIEHKLSPGGYGNDRITIQHVPYGSEVNLYDAQGNWIYSYEPWVQSDPNGGPLTLATESDANRSAYYVSIRTPEYGLESDRTVKPFFTKVFTSASLDWAVVDGKLGFSAKATFLSPEIASQMTAVKVEMGRLAEWDYSTPIVFGTNTARNGSQIVHGTEVATSFSPAQKSTDTDPDWIHSDWNEVTSEVVLHYVTFTATDSTGNTYKFMKTATDLDGQALLKVNISRTAADLLKVIEVPVNALMLGIDVSPTSTYGQLSPDKKLQVGEKLLPQYTNFGMYRQLEHFQFNFKYWTDYYTTH